MCRPERETRVLFLNGVDPTLPALIAHDTALRATLAKDTTQTIPVFLRSSRFHRFAFAGYEQEFLALLRKKYSGLTFDVIVPVTEPAFDFVRRHRSELWPNAWVFFHSVPPRAIQGIELRPRTAGIITRRTVGKTLDLARKLQPNAQRLLVVAGVSGPDKEGMDLARAAWPSYLRRWRWNMRSAFRCQS